MFHWPKAPRLSVDLDLMTTGFPEAAPRTRSRERVVRLVKGALTDQRYEVTETAGDAGVTILGAYRNSLGTSDRLKIDLDLLNRTTLMEPVARNGPVLFAAEDLKFPVVATAELMGQKLTAVAYRAVERDLFDMYRLLRSGWCQQHPAARAMYLAYSFLQDHEWARLDYPVRLRVNYRPALLRAVLRKEDMPPSLEQIREQARLQLEQIPEPLTTATPEEQELRARLLRGDRETFGTLAGETNAVRRRALAAHPGLLWRLTQASRPTTARKSRR